jgi:hypothetical protein
VFLFCIILCVVPIDVGVLFYLRSDGQYILVGDAVMAVLIIYIVHLTLGRKERHLSYQNATQYKNKQQHSQYCVTS